MSRHPAVNSYIRMVAESARPFLMSNNLEKFVLALKNSEQRVLERFVLAMDFSSWQRQQQSEETALAELEDYFRAALLKTLVLDNSQKAVPEGSTFEVFIYTRQDVSTQEGIGEDSGCLMSSLDPKKAWVAADEEERREISSPAIAPIKSSRTAMLSLEMYVESAE